MIIRIVRLHINQELKPQFVQIFLKSKDTLIGKFNCISVEIMEDYEHFEFIYTLSKWHTFEQLETYRNSDFFKATWPKIKELLIGKTITHTFKLLDFDKSAQT